MRSGAVAQRVSAAAEQYQGTQARAYTSFASMLGATALVAGVIALITASTVALAILVVATGQGSGALVGAGGDARPPSEAGWQLFLASCGVQCVTSGEGERAGTRLGSPRPTGVAYPVQPVMEPDGTQLSGMLPDTVARTRFIVPCTLSMPPPSAPAVLEMMRVPVTVRMASPP